MAAPIGNRPHAVLKREPKESEGCSSTETSEVRREPRCILQCRGARAVPHFGRLPTCGANLLERDTSLFAESREIEVDDFTGH
jgi:hypothetical protein